jgi:putative ABC transport system ATP-binding protein
VVVGLPAAEAAAEPAAEPAIIVEDLIKVYRQASVETIALRGVDLTVAKGEFVAVMGRSGCGKSTLLNLIAAADRPTAGRVLVAGVDLARADEATRSGVRGRTVGIVFQSDNLVPFLDLRENVQLAARLAGNRLDLGAADHILERVGLLERAGHRPRQLSGGEQQRAALACVLAAGAPIILADEITGELDSATADLVLDLLTEIHEERRTTVVLVTHDPVVASRADRVVALRDGRVVDGAGAA